MRTGRVAVDTSKRVDHGNIQPSNGHGTSVVEELDGSIHEMAMARLWWIEKEGSLREAGVPVEVRGWKGSEAATAPHGRKGG